MFGLCAHGNILHMDNLTLHGANPQNLYRAFNVEVPQHILDFSTNTNILTWPDIHIDLERLAKHYPDPECSRLRKLIAQRENISTSRILFTNGSNEAIFLLSQILTGSTAILQPAYTEYARAFIHLQGIFSLTEAGKFHNTIIINPANPSGQYTPLHEVIASHTAATFIVDEAYRDFLLRGEPERLCDLPNVIILRSLTKIFHLSGARIGYVIAPERVIESLRTRQPSWSVNAIAQELALAFLQDESFTAKTREFYREAVPAFVERVRAAGLETVRSDVHFFLIRADDDERVIRHLLEAGIVVRHTRNFAGLDGKYVRVATQRPEENNRLIAALREAIS